MKFVFLIILISPFITNASDQSIEEISRKFIGAPCLSDPLGEGIDSTFDHDPIIRFDRFDCQTFVETVLAIKLSNTEVEMKNNILALRYKSNVISYDNRNHFIETDWIQSNTEKGFIKDITEDYFEKNLIKSYSATISMINFYRYKNFNLDVAKIHPLVLAKIKSVSINDALTKNNIDKIPNESILLITRKNNYNKKYKTKLIVTHMGFVFINNGKTIFRHASKNKGVQDIDLKDYLYKNYGLNNSIGISILMSITR